MKTNAQVEGTPDIPKDGAKHMLRLLLGVNIDFDTGFDVRTFAFSFTTLIVTVFLLIILTLVIKRDYRTKKGLTNRSNSNSSMQADVVKDEDANALSLLGLSYLHRAASSHLRLPENNESEGKERKRNGRRTIYCWGSLPMPNINTDNGSLGVRQFYQRYLNNSTADADVKSRPGNKLISEDIIPGMRVKQIGCSGKRILFLTEDGYVYEAGNLNKADVDVSNIAVYKNGMDTRTDEFDADEELKFGSSNNKNKSSKRLRRGNDSAYNHSRCSSRSAPSLVYGFLHINISSRLRNSANNVRMNKKSELLFPGKICYVACGPQHSAAISMNGHLYTWGEGAYGRLGHGSERDECSPRKVLALIPSNVISVACGHTHTLALTVSGSVYSWGESADGRLGHGCSSLKMNCLCEPQRIMTFPNSNPKTKTGKYKEKKANFHRRVVSIACGSRHSVAVDSTGRVMCWGRNSRGQCTSLAYIVGSVELQNLEKRYVSPRSKNGNIRSCDTDINCLDSPTKPRPQVLEPCLVHDLDGVIIRSVSCGKDFTAVLSESGEIYTWGWGPYGELGRATKYSGVPGIVLPLTRISASYLESRQRHANTLHQNRKVNAPTCVAHPFADKALGMDNITFNGVMCGTYHMCALTNDGETYCWGRNHNGELGFQSDYSRPYEDNNPNASSLVCSTPKLVPVQNQNLNGAIGLACGDGYTFLIDTLTKEMNPIRCEGSAANGKEKDTEVSRADLKRQMRTEFELQKSIQRWRRDILPDWKNKSSSKSTKTLWRKGVPSQVRFMVWGLALGNDLKITPDLYYRLKEAKEHTYIQCINPSTESSTGRRPVKDQIEADLPRTFPSLRCFDINGPLYNIVKDVLETYVHSRPDIGYIQGMSYIAANICLQSADEYLAFQSLANLIHKEHMYAFYKLDKREIYAYYRVFKMAMCDNKTCKNVAEYLDTLDVHPHLYLFNWMQTLFLKVLRLDIANRVWDCFFLEGSCFILRTCIAIMKLFSSLLLKATFEDCIKLLSCSPGEEGYWAKLINEKDLFDTIEEIALSKTVQKELSMLLPFNSKLRAW